MSRLTRLSRCHRGLVACMAVLVAVFGVLTMPTLGAVRT